MDMDELFCILDERADAEMDFSQIDAQLDEGDQIVPGCCCCCCCL